MHVVQKRVGQIRAELEETLQLCSGVFQREAARSLITPDSSKASSSGLVPPAASGDASSLLTVVSDTVGADRGAGRWVGQPMAPFVTLPPDYI